MNRIAYLEGGLEDAASRVVAVVAGAGGGGRSLAAGGAGSSSTGGDVSSAVARCPAAGPLDVPRPPPQTAEDILSTTHLTQIAELLELCRRGSRIGWGVAHAW